MIYENLYLKLIENIENKFVLYIKISKLKNKKIHNNLKDIRNDISSIIKDIKKISRYEKIENHYNKKLIKRIHHDNLDNLSFLNFEISKQKIENTHEDFLKKIKINIEKEDNTFLSKLKTICYIQEILHKLANENKNQLDIIDNYKRNKLKTLKISIINEYKYLTELNKVLKNSKDLTQSEITIEKNILDNSKIMIKSNKNINKKDKKTIKKLEKEEKKIGNHNSYLIKEGDFNNILKDIDKEFLFIYNNSNFEIYWNCVPILRKKIKYIINKISIDFNKEIEKKYNIKLKKPVITITDTIRTKEYQNEIYKTNSHATNAKKSRHVSGNAVDIGLRTSSEKLLKELISENKIKEPNKIKRKIIIKQLMKIISNELNNIIDRINKEYIDYEKKIVHQNNDNKTYNLLYPIIEGQGCYHISFNSSTNAKAYIYSKSLKL